MSDYGDYTKSYEARKECILANLADLDLALEAAGEQIVDLFNDDPDLEVPCDGILAMTLRIADCISESRTMLSVAQAHIKTGQDHNAAVRDAERIIKEAIPGTSSL